MNRNADGLEIVEPADAGTNADGLDIVPVNEDGLEIVARGEEEPGQVQGLVNAFERGIKTAGGVPEVLAAVGLQGMEKPTIRQRRRAFVAAMQDPRYLEGLAGAGNDRGKALKVEGILGPIAKLDQALAPVRTLQAETLRDLASTQAEIAAVPRSAAQKRLAQAQTQGEKWQAWLQDPVELTASVALESLPPSLAASVVGAPLGPGGVAAAVGGSSGLMTFSSELLGNAGKLGYDVTDPESLRKFIGNERDFLAATRPALAKAGVVGGVDTATAGAAGRFVGPALAQGLRRTLWASGKELGMQAAGGAGGELAGQVVSGQPVDWFDVAMEAAAEVASAPGEVVSNLRESRRESGNVQQNAAPAQQGRQQQQTDISEFGGEAELGAPPNRTEGPGTPPPSAPMPLVGESPAVPEAEVHTSGREPEAAAGPPSALMMDALRGAVRERKPVPAAWVAAYDQAADVPFAMPEGYRLDGDRYVYTAPEARETPAQAMARENADAMAKLRQAKAEETPDIATDAPPAERSRADVEPVEAGVPVEDFGERPPDILDWVRESFPQGVRLPSRADFGEYVARARGVASRLLSTTRGEGADQVLKAMHEAGVYRRLESADDLAEAMVRAGEGRIGQRAERRAQRRAVEQAAAAEMDAPFSVAEGTAAPAPDNGLAMETAAPVVAAWRQQTQGAPEVELVHAPDWTHTGSDGRTRLVEAENRGGRVRVNLAAIGDVRRLGEVLDHEHAHGLLSSAAGQTALDTIAQAQLGTEGLEELRGRYGRRQGESEVGYDRRLREEWLARVAEERPTVWRRVVEAVKGWLAKHGLARLTDEEVGRAILRRLRSGKSVEPTLEMVSRRFRDDLLKAQMGNLPGAAPLQLGRASPALQSAGLPDGPVFMRKETALGKPQDPQHAYPKHKLMRLPEALQSPILVHESWTQPGAYLALLDMSHGGRNLVAALHLQTTDEGIEVTEVASVYPRDSAKILEAIQRTGTRGGVTYYDKGKVRGWLAQHSGSNSPQYWVQLLGRSKIATNEAVRQGDVRESIAQEPRATGEKIQASGAISDAVKQAVTEYLYRPRSNQTDEALAEGLVRELGIERAMEAWRRPETMPGAVWSKLTGAISRYWLAEERAARAQQDEARVAAAIQQQAAVWDDALRRHTDVAQTLQAMRDIVDASPEAHVARVRLAVERKSTQMLESHAGELQQIRDAIDRGRAEGVEQLRQDPQSNAAARTAVDQAVAESPETHRAVVMELAEEWSESPAIVAQAREQVRAKVNELLNRAPRPPGLTPAQHLRVILDDLAKRAAGIAANYFQGIATHADGLVGLYQERLGLDKAHATRLAQAMEKEWEQQVKEAKRRLPRRIAQARATRQLDAGSQVSKVDAAIRRQLRELNLRLGDVLAQESGRRDATGRHVAERVVEASGLTGDAAEAFRKVLTARWDSIVAAAQRQRLEAMQRRSGVKVTRRLKEVFERLVELDRLGASAGQFADLVKKALRAPELTEKDAAALRELVRKAQEQPEGFQRQRVAAQVLTYAERLAGEYGWIDVPMGLWYANIFSSPSTHVANVIGNGAKLLETVALEVLHRPWAAVEILRAAARGAAKGALESVPVLATGQVTGTRLLKLEAARPLEGMRLAGNWDYVLTPWRMVGRAMAVEDLVPFKAQEEIQWALTARRVARAEGLPLWGPALERRVQGLLHGTKADLESAQVQAAQEGLTGVDLRRRVNEILEQRRIVDMPGSGATARDYALKQTYNAEPYGLLGQVAGCLNDVNRKLVVTRFAVPVVRIVANLGNEGLNYFPPVGFARAALAKWGPAQTFGGRMQFRNRLDGKPIANPDQMFNLVAQSTVGTVLLGALAMAMAEPLDDDDPWLAVYGLGPRTKAQREQLRATGWMPNSVKVGGRYYSYQETQLGVVLSALGNYFDAIRWKNLDETDAVNRVAYALQTMGNSFLDRPMLGGIGDILDALKPDSTKASGAQLSRALARPLSGLVVPNAFRWLDQVFDAKVYDANTVQGQLLLQVPIARRMNYPAVNAFGEAIERGPWGRFTSPDKQDALARLLVSRQAWVPVPSLSQATVGVTHRPMTAEEYYGWMTESGPMIRDYLTRLMPTLEQLKPEDARKVVETVADKVHQGTKAKIR